MAASLSISKAILMSVPSKLSSIHFRHFASLSSSKKFFQSPTWPLRKNLVMSGFMSGGAVLMACSRWLSKLRKFAKVAILSSVRGYPRNLKNKASLTRLL